MPFFMKLYTSLSVDAMYYHSAQRAYDSVLDCEPRIRKAEAGFDKLQQQEARILEKYGGDKNAAYGQLERVYISMENQGYKIETAYGPFLQHLATVHILCAAALEAHINIQATEHLKGQFMTNFERISLETKWLFLPKILGRTGFNPGTQPFQNFARLIRFRNELVHYKTRKEIWRYPAGVPDFLEKLGLTTKAAQISLDAVKDMVTVLANDLQQEVPYWLRTREGGYFDLAIETLDN